MKIYKIAAKKKKIWKDIGRANYQRIQHRIQPFLDENPEFAEAYRKATERGEDGFSMEDRNMFLTQLGRNLKKFYSLTDEQAEAYIRSVEQMEEEQRDAA